MTQHTWQEFTETTSASSGPKTLYPITQLEIIAVNGTDSETFLQGQVTCDVTKLSNQQASSGALCDAKGRMQTTFILMKNGTHYYFILPTAMLSSTLKRLKKYAVFSKVGIETVSPPWYYCGMQDKSRPNAKKLFQVETQQAIHKIILPGNYSRALLVSQDAELMLDNCQQKVQADFCIASEAQWNLEQIHNGCAHILPTTSHLLTPQMINLQKIEGVSFKKGCYVGQEIIARTQHLGKLKRHLYLIQITTQWMPAPGEPITDQNTEMGMIVNAERESNAYVNALAILEDRALENHTLFWQQHPIEVRKRFD